MLPCHHIPSFPQTPNPKQNAPMVAGKVSSLVTMSGVGGGLRKGRGLSPSTAVRMDSVFRQEGGLSILSYPFAFACGL
eukprot:4822316-Amphidinium_carterae.1